MRGARVAVLTGAGVSTDSGIPDYRGEGAPVRTPMTVQPFLASEAARKRYWAGSHLGWRDFGGGAAQRGHLALARARGRAASSRASSRRTSTACTGAPAAATSSSCTAAWTACVCLQCGQHYARQAIADRLAELNPSIDLGTAIRARPDGVGVAAAAATTTG